MEMQRGNAKRQMLILKQLSFLEARNSAFERLWLSSSLMDKIRWAIWPQTLIWAVDAVQRHILSARAKDLKEQMTKPKIEVVSPTALVH